MAKRVQSTMSKQKDTMNETVTQQDLAQNVESNEVPSTAGDKTDEAPSTTNEAPSTTNEAGDKTDEAPSTTNEVLPAIGIGTFVRYCLLKTNKTSPEILQLVLKTFAGAKTTPACIAWYKSDLRKKGLLPAGATRGTNVVQFTEEELRNLTK